jgi:hypothetical protein
MTSIDSVLRNWSGAWTGSATGATTLHASIVDQLQSGDGQTPYATIARHIQRVRAVPVHDGSFAGLVAQMDDTQDMAGYSELFEPVVIRVRGPSAWCVATSTRVAGWVVPTAAYRMAADWVIGAVDAYVAARTLPDIDMGWIRSAGNPPVLNQGAKAAAATAIRLASRITKGTTLVIYSDVTARRTAKAEFSVAITSLVRSFAGGR